MILPFTHPSVDELMEFSSSSVTSPRRDEIAGHLQSCVRCQDALRFARRMRDVSPDTHAEAPPADLLARALVARDRGERFILPSTDGRHRHRGPIMMRATVALAVALVIAIGVGRSDLVAEATDSTLTLQPAQPRAGDTIEVTYRPVAGLFAKTDSLILRARLRRPEDRMYPSAVPPERTGAVAVLRPESSGGGEFRGRFTLPPGIVFASLAVESPDSGVVDANGTRLWEVMLHGDDGRPVFDALSQRLNDMMGRSWEEGYATSKRQTELYPDRIDAWSTREFFERALFGQRAADSIAAAYKERTKALIEAAKAQPRISADDIETIFFDISVKIRRPGATARDTQEFRYWWDRIRREHPRHPQIAQHVAFDFSKEQWENARFVLDSLEKAFPHLVPLRGPGKSLASMGMQSADRAKDAPLYRKWLERSLDAAPDSALYAAMALSRRAEYRADGMAGLRALLAARPEALVTVRSLAWNAGEYSRRVADERRRVLLALGRALIADGQTRAGIDTLTLASQGVWNVQIFRGLVAGYTAAKDPDNARRFRVKLAVDPRTPGDTVAAITAEGRETMGVARWDSAVTAARAEMNALIRERSKLKTLRGMPRAVDADSRTRTLAELTNGRPAVVIFWSKDCGAAIEALPKIVSVARRLHDAGTPVLLVNNGPRTKEVDAALADGKWTLPVYYDARGEMGNAFNSFGTPQYFVVDAAGRIRFDFVDEEAELIAQIGAISS